jgi:hypothetical protein
VRFCLDFEDRRDRRIAQSQCNIPSSSPWLLIYLRNFGRTSILRPVKRQYDEIDRGESGLPSDEPAWLYPCENLPEIHDAAWLHRTDFHVAATNPNTTFNFANVIPVATNPYFYCRNDVPYTENYMFSFQRQIGARMLLTMSYVGNEGHHLLAVISTNPSDQALCLSLSQPSEVAPGSPTCGSLRRRCPDHHQHRAGLPRHARWPGSQLRREYGSRDD